MKQRPNLLKMIRAPFLSSILAPLLFGTIAAVIIKDGAFSFPGFFFVLVMGIGLHAATNVYNDIYDTIQRTDKLNVHRNEFSGGSGILVDFPDMMPRMYKIARVSLVIALAGAIGIAFFIDKNLYPWLAGLYLLSAFFAKYYTAAPVKLAYRGMGEVSVWFAFGPMAVLVAAVSQNVLFEPLILLLMPISGLSTLSILWMGQMIDLDADKATGKLGAVSRIGTGHSRLVYIVIQSLLIANIIMIPLFIPKAGYFVLISLLPYIMLFPKVVKIIMREHSNANGLKPGAGMNVMVHLQLSILLILGLLGALLASSF
ncbi:MAG: prenyltransferase [Ignavibacteria bacterium]|nr:prenyltransferase [Ignavibacteria bacterium]